MIQDLSVDCYLELCAYERAQGKRPKFRFKGQLISECLFCVINFPKNKENIWQISAQESKKWPNQQNKDTFL